MKKNFTLTTLFVFTMLMSAAFANEVFAKTGQKFASDKISVAYAPAVSTNVVINEVYGGSELPGNVYNADFIELYNASGIDVDISDYSVQYYTAGQINGGAPTSTAHIPANIILPAFSYYVIRVSPIRATGADLPCATLDDSASFAETGIDSDGGKLILTSTGADLPDCMSSLNVVDRLGYGAEPAEPCNETFNANQPSTTTSVQRRAGRADSDNNSTDFTAFSAPTPCVRLLGSTAAMVNVGGRVINSKGRGISGVLIRMTDSAGIVHTTYSTSTGNYNFADIEVGQTLVFEVKAKNYSFTQPTQVVSLSEESTTIDFTGFDNGRFRRVII